MSARRTEPKNLFDLFPGEDHYSVTFSIASACTVPRVEPEQYTETIDGEVVNISGDLSERPVGRFEGYRLRRDWAEEEGESFFTIADAFSAEAHGYLLEVFDEDGELRPEAERALGDDPGWGPVLIAHKLEIDPAHRGRGLGYAVINSFIETFEPGSRLVIAQAAPIIPPDLDPQVVGTPEYRRRRARGTRKLRRYWERFGFVSVSPASEYLAMNLALRRPSVFDVIRAARSRKRRQQAKGSAREGAGPETGETR